MAVLGERVTAARAMLLAHTGAALGGDGAPFDVLLGAPAWFEDLLGIVGQVRPVVLEAGPGGDRPRKQFRCAGHSVFTAAMTAPARLAPVTGSYRRVAIRQPCAVRVKVS